MSKRVLFVTNSGSLGGASLDLLPVLEGMQMEGIEPVVVLAEEGPFNAEVEARGVRTVRVDQPWWVTSGTVDAWLYSMRLLPKAVEKMRAIIRDEGIAAVVTNASVVPAGALAAAIEAKPHLWIAREFAGQGGFLGPLDAATIHGCMGALSVCVICVSESLAAVVRESIEGEKVEAVFAGIVTDQFAGCRPDHGSQVIVSIGTTTPEKGLDDLVEAAGILAGRGGGFLVRVVGDFDHEAYRMKVEKRVKVLGIRDRFEFTKFQRDIRPYLGGAAVYCTPSHTEGMGRTIIEAMSAGLPVVATDCGGPRDLVDEGRTGLLVPVKNPEALAEALRGVLANPKLAASMGEAGRRRAQQRFDMGITVPLMVQQIKRALVANPDKTVVPLARWMMQLFSISGSRVLLGKKLKLLQCFERFSS